MLEKPFLDSTFSNIKRNHVQKSPSFIKKIKIEKIKKIHTVQKKAICGACALCVACARPWDVYYCNISENYRSEISAAKWIELHDPIKLAPRTPDISYRRTGYPMGTPEICVLQSRVVPTLKRTFGSFSEINAFMLGCVYVALQLFRGQYFTLDKTFVSKKLINLPYSGCKIASSDGKFGELYGF